MEKESPKTFNEILNINAPIKEIVEGEVLDCKIQTQSYDEAEDYKLARETMREIIKTGRESLDLMLTIANESQSPRSGEVVSQTIQTLAETSNRLIELHQKFKDIKKNEEKKESTNVTNNNLIVTTAELQKMLIEARKDINKNEDMNADNTRGL